MGWGGMLDFDGSLYSVPPPFCGSLLAVRTPKGEDLTLRFDNVNGKGEKKMAPGSMACECFFSALGARRSVRKGRRGRALIRMVADFNAAMAYRLLTTEQQEIANHSTVTYAPHALFVLSRSSSSSLLLTPFYPSPTARSSRPRPRHRPPPELQLLDRLHKVHLGRLLHRQRGKRSPARRPPAVRGERNQDPANGLA